MKEFSETFHNNSNDCIIHANIKKYFLRFPNSTPKECCRILGINHKKYGNRAKTIKCRLKKWKESLVSVTKYGQVLNPLKSTHRSEYEIKDKIPACYISILEEKANNSKIIGEWYRSPNRNKQLQYVDNHIFIRIYPKSGTCRILPRKIISFEEIRIKVDNAFAKILPSKFLLSNDFENMISGLQIKQRHRVFPVGPISPFKNEFYRRSLGINILADESHPNNLEVHEYWPTWIPRLFESHNNLEFLIENNTRTLAEYAKQIRCHMEVMEGIRLASNQLNKTISKLNHAIEGKKRDAPPNAKTIKKIIQINNPSLFLD
jgi:hypothetical protein